MRVLDGGLLFILRGVWYLRLGGLVWVCCGFSTCCRFSYLAVFGLLMYSCAIGFWDL